MIRDCNPSKVFCTMDERISIKNRIATGRIDLNNRSLIRGGYSSVEALNKALLKVQDNKVKLLKM